MKRPERYPGFARPVDEQQYRAAIETAEASFAGTKNEKNVVTAIAIVYEC